MPPREKIRITHTIKSSDEWIAAVKQMCRLVSGPLGKTVPDVLIDAALREYATNHGLAVELPERRPGRS